MTAPVMMRTASPAASAPRQVAPASGGTDDAQRDRGIAGRVVAQQRAVEGEAVHGGVVVRRHADGRDDVLGQHPAERLAQAELLALGDDGALDQPLDEAAHAVDAEVLGVVAGEAGGDVGDAAHRCAHPPM
jgi:hypothetical protein